MDASKLPRPPAPKTGLVLLIEDEETVARLIKIWLERANFDVVWAPDGAAALQAVRERGSAVSIAFVDWKLPDMTGGDLCRRLRQAIPDLPLLLTSGRTRDIEPFEFEQHGPIGFLGKPYIPAQLIGQVRALLHAAAV